MTPEHIAPVVELRRAESLVYAEDLDHPELAPDDEHHLVRVLRLRGGANVAVSDGHGRYRMAVLVGMPSPRTRRPGGAVSLEPAGPVREVPAPQPSITVAFAVPKGDRYELVIQKLTELGVDRIIPLQARRSVARPEGDATAPRRTRLERVVREACSQSRRLHLPTLDEPTTLGELVRSHARKLAVAEPGGGPLEVGTSTIVVGPEGGFEPGEIPEGVARVGLGPTILRIETAAIAAGAMLALTRAGTLPAQTEIP